MQDCAKNSRIRDWAFPIRCDVMSQEYTINRSANYFFVKRKNRRKQCQTQEIIPTHTLPYYGVIRTNKQKQLYLEALYSFVLPQFNTRQFIFISLFKSLIHNINKPFTEYLKTSNFSSLCLFCKNKYNEK